MFVPTENRNAIYHYDGTKWTAPADMVMLQPADYTEMGQSHPNLSKAEPFISVWLMRQFPYAAEGDVKNVVWNHYASGASSYDCSQYVFDGLVWTPNNFVEECTEQFVYAPTGWIYDPNVTINLPAGKNQPESTKYFQACVDWVFENICKPLGDTSIKSGLFYISSTATTSTIPAPRHSRAMWTCAPAPHRHSTRPNTAP